MEVSWSVGRLVGLRLDFAHVYPTPFIEKIIFPHELPEQFCY